jgi:putative SOS response-associated peptidase YedK
MRTAFYSPARDLAYIGPKIVERAMVTLNEENWEPWLKEHLTENGVSVDTICDTEAPIKLARTLNKIIRLPLQEALKASEFEELPAAIQLLFYARMGQIFLAALWSAVKDTHAPDDAPPSTLASIMADAEEQLSDTIRQGSSNG